MKRRTFNATRNYRIGGKERNFIQVSSRSSAGLLTNMPQLYDKTSCQTLPPFGLSDHNVVGLCPMTRASRDGTSRETVFRRDTRPSRKQELSRYLCSIHWSLFQCAADDCDENLQLLTVYIKIRLETIMPLKKSRVHVNYPPWVTHEV